MLNVQDSTWRKIMTCLFYLWCLFATLAHMLQLCCCIVLPELAQTISAKDKETPTSVWEQTACRFVEQMSQLQI